MTSAGLDSASDCRVGLSLAIQQSLPMRLELHGGKAGEPLVTCNERFSCLMRFRQVTVPSGPSVGEKLLKALYNGLQFLNDLWDSLHSLCVLSSQDSPSLSTAPSFKVR